MNAAAPALRLRGVVKRFGATTALSGIDLDILRGESHALLGENGAGKSTLIKIVAGVYPCDEGSLELGGKKIAFRSPSEAFHAGIAVIHQETSLVPTLTAVDNVFLGDEALRGARFDRAAMEKRYRGLAERVGAGISPNARVRDLGSAEKKIVEIMKALHRDSSVVIMDEPTDSLTEAEADRLFAVMDGLKAEGRTIIYITHFLDEVFRVCDRATVLKDGSLVATREVASVQKRELIRMMVGRDVDAERAVRGRVDGPVLLDLRGVSVPGRVREASLQVRAGEVVGLIGVVGSGKTELARAAYGAGPRSAGRVSVNGKPRAPRTPAAAVRMGMGMVSEDRKSEGLVMVKTIRENATLANLGAYSRFGVVSRPKEKAAAAQLVAKLGIKCSGPEQKVSDLSGGNQQKVALARWIDADPPVVIMDEPTRGVDVGAKRAIYDIVRTLATDGKAVLFISSEAPEILQVADRILVMRKGRVREEFDSSVSEDRLLHAMLEGGNDEL